MTKMTGAGQREQVRDLMLDGQWRSLEQIAHDLDYPETSISARLRDLRKAEYGSYTVTRKRDNGIQLYRVEQ